MEFGGCDRPSGNLLDTAPPADMKDEIRRISKTVSGVAELEKCFIRKMGFKYYVDLHVIVDGRISVTDGHRIGHEVEAAILALQPKIANVLVHIEPTAETRY